MRFGRFSVSTYSTTRRTRVYVGVRLTGRTTLRIRVW